MEQERRAFNRRSNDERLAVLEDRYGNLNERVMALEEILQRINGSVDRMASEISATRKEFTDELSGLRADVATNNANIRKDLAPITELQLEARATYRFLRKVVFWVVLPPALLYVAVSGIPAAEGWIQVLIRILVSGIGG